MSFLRSNKRKHRVAELLEEALAHPVDSIARLNLLTEANLVMSMEINKHTAWTDFNTTIQQISGR